MSIIENTIHGNTMLLTLNNPTKRNSMVKGFHDEFQSSIKMAEENKDVFSIIITGAGDFFLPARKLFSKFGFKACPPFAHYKEDPNSHYYTLNL